MENITINNVIDEIRTAREDDYVLIKLAIYLSADHDDKIADEIIVVRKNVVVKPNNDNDMIAIGLIFNNKNKDFGIVHEICQNYLYSEDETSTKFVLDLIEYVDEKYGVSMEVQFIDASTDGKIILFTGYLSGNYIYYGEEYEVDENNCNKKKKPSSDDMNDVGPELTKDYCDIESKETVEEEMCDKEQKEKEEELTTKQRNDEQLREFRDMVIEIQKNEIKKKSKKYWER